jgi:hypothetical protein
VYLVTPKGIIWCFRRTHGRPPGGRRRCVGICLTSRGSPEIDSLARRRVRRLRCIRIAICSVRTPCRWSRRRICSGRARQGRDRPTARCRARSRRRTCGGRRIASWTVRCCKICLQR